VFPALAVVLVVGGLFWASVWTVMRSPSRASTVVATEVKEAAAPSTTDSTSVAVATDDVAVPTDQVVPTIQIALDDPIEIQVEATSPLDETAEFAGPLYGPEVPETIAEGDPAEGAAVADASAPTADRADELIARAEELTAKADDLTARAETLTAKAEELTVKIDGLTARLEELETKLGASAALTTRPAAVPSPVAVSRPGESVVARDNRSTSGTRAPWVVLPQPEPGSRVTAGPLVLETRARGEAPISQIRLQLDGVAVPVSLEKRDDTTWRGRATTRVGPGQHVVAVAVVDVLGRIGSYRWQFDAIGS
jgi:hypothetical protein